MLNVFECSITNVQMYRIYYLNITYSKLLWNVIKNF
jgi:hypothetical protein